MPKKHERDVSEQYTLFYMVLRNVPPEGVVSLFDLPEEVISSTEWQRAVHLWTKKPKFGKRKLIFSGLVIIVLAIAIAGALLANPLYLVAIFMAAVLSSFIFIRPQAYWSHDYADSVWRALKAAGYDPSQGQFVLRRTERD